MSFGSSSTLARQIEQGAPANVFASADEKWMNYLADKKLIADGTRKDLLGNDLVLVVPADKPMHVTIGKSFDLIGPAGRQWTSGHRRSRACAGRDLRRAGAENLGMWDKVEPRLARTEDVRAALLLVERGEAPAGIVYSTDAAVSKAVMIAGTFPGRQSRSGDLSVRRRQIGRYAGRARADEFSERPEARAVFTQRGFKVE